MARKNSTFDDLVEIAALLPWWLSFILAAVLYVAIHHFAIVAVPYPADPKHMSEMITGQLIHMLALLGQYIIPLAFVFGAIASVVGRRKRAKLYLYVAGQPVKNALNEMNWREYEMLVGEWFRKQGYVVTETGGVADGGVDLILYKDGERYIVQCKQWKAYKVGVNIVRELLGVMVTQGAAGGYLVTSGVFTEDARRFATESNITLIDGSKLSQLIGEARTVQKMNPVRKVEAQQQASPQCPKCGSIMVMRKAAKGARVGESFWGCPKFPSCRGVIPLK